MDNLFNLKNKVAVVTGGYGHLGRGIVRALNDFGATVVVAGRNKEKFLEVFSEEERETIKFSAIDITNAQSVDGCINDVYAEYKHIDILVNNAHATKGKLYENLTDEEWSYTMDGVVGAVHRTFRSIIPLMKAQGYGKIINIASMYGIVSPDFSMYKGDDCEKYTNPPHYGAAKAAIIQLTKYYAVLLGPHNINVNAVSPGPFPKTAIQEQNPEFVRRLKMKNPLGKIGKPEDLGGVIVLLRSPA